MDQKYGVVGERIIAGLLILAGAWFFWQSRGFDYQTDFGRPGPGFLPDWLSLLLVVIAVLWLLSTIGAKSQPETKARPVISWQPLLIVLLVIAVSALVEWIGFPIIVASFLATVLGLIERERWWKVAWVTVVVTSIFYLVFKVWLMLPLPMGVLFER